MKQPFSPSRALRSRRAFTLVEVVFALAIFVFIGFALIGLLGVGLQDTVSARKRMEAASVAEKICSLRRAAPTNDFGPTTALSPNPQPGFPLPRLDTVGDNITSLAPVYINQDGITNSLNGAEFGFLYRVTPIVGSTSAGSGVSTHASTVYLCLYWPPQASPASANTSHYELTTTFALP